MITFTFSFEELLQQHSVLIGDEQWSVLVCHSKESCNNPTVM